MRIIEYKVSPLGYGNRVLSAACLHWDFDLDYIYDSPDQHESTDEEYNYRLSIICYILRVYGLLSDHSISVLLHFEKVSIVSYYIGIANSLQPFDDEMKLSLHNIMSIADKLNVSTIKVPVIHIQS